MLYNIYILFILIYWIYRIWFGCVLWHINHCRLFIAKSFVYIYIKYTGFGLVWFGLAWLDGISTIVGYLMPNTVYTYISNIYDLVWVDFMVYHPFIYCQILFIHIYWIYMIWLDLVLWHVNHCGLFNAKSSLYIYIQYILNIYDLVGFGFMACQLLWVI